MRAVVEGRAALPSLGPAEILEGRTMAFGKKTTLVRFNVGRCSDVVAPPRPLGKHEAWRFHGPFLALRAGLHTGETGRPLANHPGDAFRTSHTVTLLTPQSPLYYRCNIVLYVQHASIVSGRLQPSGRRMLTVNVAANDGSTRCSLQSSRPTLEELC